MLRVVTVSSATQRLLRSVALLFAVAPTLSAGCGRSLNIGGGDRAEGGSAGDAPSGEGGAANIDGAPVHAEFDACLELVRTVCNKLFFECNGAPAVPNPCPPSVDSTCPDRYFSPGSAADIASLSGCAAEWRGAACADLQQGLRPRCVPLGEREEGASCLFGSQCSSGYCAAATEDDGSPGCGVCGRVVEAGEDCASVPAHCPDGYECRGVCEPSPPFGAPPGAPCERLGQCAGGTFCLTLAGESEPSCQPAPNVGEPCPVDTPMCAGNCSLEGSCERAPREGEPCALGANDAHICQAGLRCELEAPDGPRCVALLALGQACKPLNQDFSSGGCEPGALCHCDSVACASATCVRRRDAGESCGGVHDVCMAGTECRATVCVGRGSQALFTRACGG